MNDYTLRSSVERHPVTVSTFNDILNHTHRHEFTDLSSLFQELFPQGLPEGSWNEAAAKNAPLTDEAKIFFAMYARVLRLLRKLIRHYHIRFDRQTQAFLNIPQILQGLKEPKTMRGKLMMILVQRSKWPLNISWWADGKGYLGNGITVVPPPPESNKGGPPTVTVSLPLPGSNRPTCDWVALMGSRAKI